MEKEIVPNPELVTDDTKWSVQGRYYIQELQDVILYDIALHGGAMFKFEEQLVLSRELRLRYREQGVRPYVAKMRWNGLELWVDVTISVLEMQRASCNIIEIARAACRSKLARAHAIYHLTGRPVCLS